MVNPAWPMIGVEPEPVSVRLARAHAWERLIGRPAGTPAPAAFPLFGTPELARWVRWPQAWLRRARAEGRVLTIGRGLHLAVPDGAASDWRPHPVEAAWLVAAMRFGRIVPYVSAMSAAALHGAAPLPAGAVHVTVPRQVAPLRLAPVGITIVFHQRAERKGLARTWLPGAMPRGPGGPVLETMRGELCEPRVATRVQTALDLLHSPSRSGAPENVDRAVALLLAGVRVSDIRTATLGQRRHTAFERWMYLRPPLEARTRGGLDWLRG